MDPSRTSISAEIQTVATPTYFAGQPSFRSLDQSSLESEMVRSSMRITTIHCERRTSKQAENFSAFALSGKRNQGKKRAVFAQDQRGVSNVDNLIIT